MSADTVLLPGLRHQGAAKLVEGGGRAAPVDAYEVAAALEANGISDRTAQERYGKSDVFALGESVLAELRSPAPRRAGRPRLVAGRIEVWPTLQRGLVFVLPALLTASAMGGRASHAEVVLLLAAVAYGWAIGQGVAYVGYALTSAGSDPEARRLMRNLAGLALVPAAIALGAVAWTAPSIRYVAVVALGQIGYVLASTIGVVLQRPGAMLVALIPGLLVAAPDVALPGSLPPAIVLPAIAVSAMATIGIAVYLCRAGRAASRRVTRAILADCSLYVGYGACLASLLSLGLLDGLVAPVGTAGIGLTLTPLVGGVMVAEWQLARYRTRSELALRTTETPEAFAAAIRRALLQCLGGYLGVLVTLILLAAWSVRGLEVVGILRFAATGLLGWSFLGALLLVAHRQVAPVLVVTSAGVVLAAGRYLLLDPPRALDLAAGYLVICGWLALTLSVLVWQRLTKVAVHR